MKDLSKKLVVGSALSATLLMGSGCATTQYNGRSLNNELQRDLVKTEETTQGDNFVSSLNSMTREGGKFLWNLGYLVVTCPYWK